MLVEQRYVMVKYLLTVLRQNFEFSLQCVNISRGERNKRDDAGGVRKLRKSIPK